MEADGSSRRVVVADLEAGAGTVLRMGGGPVDIAVVVVEPTEKSLEVATRLLEVTGERNVGQVVVVANRVNDAEDVERIRRALGVDDVVAVDDDPSVRRTDRDGLAPLDAVPESPAVRSLVALAGRLSPPA